MDYTSPTRLVKLPGLPEVLKRNPVPARIIDKTGGRPSNPARTRTRPAPGPQLPHVPVANSISSLTSNHFKQATDHRHYQHHNHQPLRPPVQPKLYTNPPPQPSALLQQQQQTLSNATTSRRQPLSSNNINPNHQQRNLDHHSEPPYQPLPLLQQQHQRPPPPSIQTRTRSPLQPQQHFQDQQAGQPQQTGQLNKGTPNKRVRTPNILYPLDKFASPPKQQAQRRAVSSSPALATDPNLEDIKNQLKEFLKRLEPLVESFQHSSINSSAAPSANQAPAPAYGRHSPIPPLHSQQPPAPPPQQPTQQQPHYHPQYHKTKHHPGLTSAISKEDEYYLDRCPATLTPPRALPRSNHLINCCGCQATGQHSHHHHQPATRSRVEPDDDPLADMSMGSREYFRRYNLA